MGYLSGNHLLAPMHDPISFDTLAETVGALLAEALPAGERVEVEHLGVFTTELSPSRLSDEEARPRLLPPRTTVRFEPTPSA